MSAFQVVSRYGVNMYGVQHDSKREAVDKALMVMRFSRFTEECISERWGDRSAKTLGECFTNYRWPEERESGMMHPHQSPLHGPYSHGCDMFQIMASQVTLPVLSVPLDVRVDGVRSPQNENFRTEEIPDFGGGAGTQGRGPYRGRRSNLY
jgi:hypothetical protein